tara:strand:- start:72 stop:413 length:342 start_codon:yes stop_codon:yes gene_type:complete
MLCCAELHSFQGLFLCHESSCTVCYCSAHSSLLEGGVDILKHKGTVAAIYFCFFAFGQRLNFDNLSFFIDVATAPPGPNPASARCGRFSPENFLWLILADSIPIEWGRYADLG